MPANRDPRKKSRTARNRRTSSSTRSVRSKASAKDTPKPTSSATRSTTKGTSKKVTTGKGGNKIISPRLRQALKEAATPKRKTPAKTPPKSTKVKTNPASKTPRGAQGPRTAPQQGPSQRVNTRGLVGSRPKPKTTPKPPPTQKYKPRASYIADQIRQAKDMKTRTAARRVLKAGGTVAQIKSVLSATNPYSVAATIIGADVMNRGVADGTLKGKPTAAKQGPANPASQPRQFKAPTKKNALVLAKKNGKEGMMRNGVFVPSSWSMSQKARYQAQLKKNK